MINSNNLRKLTYILYFFASLLLIFCVIIYRNPIISTVRESINYSLNILIPSLFPMIFISSFISNSPAQNIISKLFSLVCKYIFRLPSCCSCAIIFGLTCGYPVAAKLCSDLLSKNQISKEQANRLCCFCVNAGIPFGVLFVGGVIFSSIKIGWLLFFANTISSFIIGFILSCKSSIPNCKNIKIQHLNIQTNLNKSVKSTLYSILTMCGYIIIFSIFLNILKSSGIFEFLNSFMIKLKLFPPLENLAILIFLLDVVSGINCANNLHLNSEIYLIGLSFSGLCLHFQIFSFFKDKTIKYLDFYIFRLVHIFLSLEIFRLLKLISPEAISVISTVKNIIPKVYNSNATVSVFLILLSLTYIYMNKTVAKNINM